METKKLLRIFMALLFIAVGASWWIYHRDGNVDKQRLQLFGNVDIREIDLAFNNSEHVERILVREGDRVRKNQLLATLHRTRLQAEVAVAEAKVAAQTAVVARLETGSRPEEVRQARANVAAAEAKVVDMEVIFKRTQQLLKKRVISKQAGDDAQADYDTARANLKVAQEALALAVEGPRSEDIDEAKALLKADEAQLALAREVLKDTDLYAPDDGVIRDRILEPGDMATPQTPVLTLALTNPVWVRTYAPEAVLGRLSPGMTASISTDSYPQKTYRGWVGFVSPTAEFTPKNVETPELRTRLVYQVRVYVCNPRDELRLGMPATVAIRLDQGKPEPGQSISGCTKSGDDQRGS